MDAHSISSIRNARFAHAVRGYDRHEVDQFLSELADWLERDGAVGDASERVRAELARTGEQVADILTEAHDAAQQIREEASREARQSLVQANATAESLRSQARELAAGPYQEPAIRHPDILETIDYDAYQQIRRVNPVDIVRGAA